VQKAQKKTANLSRELGQQDLDFCFQDMQHGGNEWVVDGGGGAYGKWLDILRMWCGSMARDVVVVVVCLFEE